MKPFGQTPKKSKSRSYPDTKLLHIKQFVMEDGKAVGIIGQAYPSREQIEVRMDMECEKAKNTGRKDFEALRSGFRLPNREVMKIEPGAVLRLPCHVTGEGQAVTEWINVLTRNADETKDKLRFGFASVELYTPKALRQKRDEIRKELKGAVSDEDLEFKVDARMLEVCQNQQRYDGAVRLYEHAAPIKGDFAQAMEGVADYYAKECFKPVTDELTQKQYERAQPGIFIRALDPDGGVVAALDVSPAELYRAQAASVEERTAVVEEKIASILEVFPDAQLNLLPYSRISISKFPLTVTDNNYDLKAFRRAQNMSCEYKVDPEGERYIEARAMEAVVEFSNNGMVSSFSVPEGAKNVDVARLDEKGGEMPVAGMESATEEPPAEESQAQEQPAPPRKPRQRP